MADVGRIDGHQGGSTDPPASRGTRGELDRRIARFAERQAGVVERSQLLELGISVDAIDHRLQALRWRALHPGVYFVGSHRPSTRGLLIAALLATKPGSFLSHTSSGAIREICAEGPRIHVTTPRRGARTLKGVVVHRPRHLDSADVTRVEGLPVATLARTLLDMAEVVSFGHLAKAFEEAERREILNPFELAATMGRNPGRRGLKPLRLLLTRHSLPTSNEGLERRLQEILHEEGIPPPATNVIVHGYELDAPWPDAKFAIELDSRAFHSHWSAAERDRMKDARLMREEILVLRVTHRRMREDRPELVTDIWTQLRLRGARGSA